MTILLLMECMKRQCQVHNNNIMWVHKNELQYIFHKER